MTDWKSLADLVETEKRLTAAIQMQVDVKEAGVAALHKQIAALQAEIDTEAKARVELQIEMGECESKLKQIVTFMTKSQAKAAAASAAASAKSDDASGSAASGRGGAVPLKYGVRTGSTPNPEMILARVAQSLNRFRAAAQREEAGNSPVIGLTDGEHALLTHIRATPIDEYPSYSARSMISQWVMAYHALHTQSSKSNAEMKTALLSQISDNALLYHLFTVAAEEKDVTEAERREAEEFQLDVTTRLRSPAVLAAAFETVWKRGVNTIALNTFPVLLMGAALLGRWDALRETGKALESKGETLRGFHDMAQQQPGFPDLETIFNMVEEGGKVRPSANLSDVRWCEFQLTSSMLKLQKVETPDSDAKLAIENDFKDYPDGKELCSPDAIHKILRSGAVAQYIAAGANSIPVHGPCADDAMDLRGWVELTKDGSAPGSGSASGLSRQEEHYVMKRVSCDEKSKVSIWRGTYTMTNRVVNPADNDKDKDRAGMELKCVFEATITLQELAQGDGVFITGK